MTLWELLVVGVLATNAAAILHEERFLARCTSAARARRGRASALRGALGALRARSRVSGSGWRQQQERVLLLRSRRPLCARLADVKRKHTRACVCCRPLPLPPLLASTHHRMTALCRAGGRADGWGFQQLGQSAAEVGPLKYQAISAIHAATYFQFPLIFINSLVILVKLVFG